jgi:antitoxin (DNA-binding transcriptional repressor) of toxin-antitoxin stability system
LNATCEELRRLGRGFSLRVEANELNGEEVIIAKAGKPVAKLVPLTERHDRSKRRLGALAGVAAIPPDFDAPLPDHVIDTFESR